MKKKTNWQMIFSFLFLILTLGIVLSIGLTGNDLADLVEALKMISPSYLIACGLCWCAYVFFDGLVVHHFLKVQHKPINLRQSTHAAITGIYYSNVTPGATGGQPMEMYTLSKYGVPIGISGSSMTVKFILFQLILLITGTVLWADHSDFVAEHMSGKYWIIILGYAFNFISIGMLILMAINKRAVLWLISKVINIGTKLHLIKNPDATRSNWQNICESFLSSMQLVIRHPKVVLIQCLISFAQLMSQMMVVYFIYHAFGLEGVTTGELITMAVLLYISASYTPLPGASGAQEGGFAVMFGGIFPEGTLFVALLLWRFFTYYLTILVGVIITIYDNVRNIRKAKRAAASETAEGSKVNGKNQ